MKNIFYKIVTIIFVLSLPFLILLSIIPLLAFGGYLKLWDEISKQKLKSSTIKQRGEVWKKGRVKDVWPIFKDIFPRDAKSAFDIGPGDHINQNFLRESFEKYTTLDLKNADINQNLDKESKIPLQNNSFDIVIMSNILEHLCDPVPIIIEANRISKKYLVIGLPNEFPLGARLITFFGRYDDRIFPFGHKHKLSINSIERFVKSIWSEYIRKEYVFNSFGSNYIPSPLQKSLMKFFPSLFVGEVFYLVKKSKIDKNKIRK